MVSNLYTPDVAGGAAIYTDCCEVLVQRGHEVTARVAYPYFPEWQDKSGRNGWRIERTTVHGVHVERHGQAFRRGGIRRLVDRLVFEGSQTLSQLRSLPRGRFDVVLTFATHPGTTTAAALVAVARRLPLVVSVQDIAGDAAGASGLAGDRAATWLGRLEGFVLGRADLLYGISPGMVDRLGELAPGVPVELRPNWLHRSLADLAEAHRERAEARFADRGDGPLRLLYGGNIGGKQHLLAAVQRIAGLGEACELLVHASGRGADEIAEWAAGAGATNVEVRPILPEAGFIEALLACDLFLISEATGSGHSYMPSKLLPALATGTPILAICDAGSSLGREVRGADHGVHLGWEELDELGSVLGAIDGDWLRAASDAARRRSAAWDRDALVGAIEADLERVALSPGGAPPSRRRSPRRSRRDPG